MYFVIFQVGLHHALVLRDMRLESDSHTAWVHSARRILIPSSWPTAPDSQQRPHEVARGYAGRLRKELTLLEESEIPDACHTCQEIYGVCYCLKHLWTSIGLRRSWERCRNMSGT